MMWGDHFKHLPVVAFPWDFLFLQDPFYLFTAVTHLACIAPVKGCRREKHRKCVCKPSAQAPNLLRKDGVTASLRSESGGASEEIRNSTQLSLDRAEEP